MHSMLLEARELAKISVIGKKEGLTLVSVRALKLCTKTTFDAYAILESKNILKILIMLGIVKKGYYRQAQCMLSI